MTETEKKPRRWLFPLLVASLAANLLIVGIVVGAAFSRGDAKRPDIGPARGLVGEPFIRALPADQRREMLKEIARDAPKIRKSREKLKARFDAFLAALRADPYDPEAVAKLMQEQRSAALRRQDIGEALLLQRLEAMTTEERAAYADALEKGLGRQRRPAD